MAEKELKRFSIVIQETGDHNGEGFIVFLEGDKERFGKVPNNELSPAEFWGGFLFNVCKRVLAEKNTVVGITDSRHAN